MERLSLSLVVSYYTIRYKVSSRSPAQASLAWEASPLPPPVDRTLISLVPTYVIDY